MFELKDERYSPNKLRSELEENLIELAIEKARVQALEDSGTVHEISSLMRKSKIDGQMQVCKFVLAAFLQMS